MISIPFGSTSRRITFSSVARTAVAPVVAVVAVARGWACVAATDGIATAASATLAIAPSVRGLGKEWDFLAGIIVVSL